MTPVRIFISSVQREFAGERERLRDYLRSDPIMRRFFEVFLFEDVPASDRRPEDVYLGQVERCDIYVGLFGNEYGFEDELGVSPTEREFDRATELEKQRLIFVRGADDGERHPRMLDLIARAQAGLVRRRFATPAELIAGLYAALVQYLEAKDLLRFGPFDAAQCTGATLDDLDVEGMRRFIRVARRVRQFPLPEETEPPDLLRHLDLLNKGRLTNAAILLFGRAPQRFLISSEIKCAQFHGTYVAKPIPSYHVYKGTVFELVDQAANFVLSRIDLSVGTRAESVQAPVAYEIPQEVVTEAIVNAVVHRDYTDNSSVQVMLFTDRLEVMNTGGLPPALTVESLRVAHQSLPRNPLLAESMYLKRYIEKMGTGTVDMIRRCAEAGLPEPEYEAGLGFVTRIWRRGRAAEEGRGTTPEEPGTTAITTGTTAITARKTTPERILAVLAADPELTQRVLAERVGVTQEGIRYHMRKLKAAGIIRRVGSSRAGHWVIVDQADDSPTTEKTTGTTTGKTAGKTTAKRILAALRRNPEISLAAVAKEVDLTVDGVRYHIDKLKSAGAVRRVGSSRSGRWEVLK